MTEMFDSWNLERMAGGWEVTKDCSSDNEQGHQWGPREVEFQHWDW